MTRELHEEEVEDIIVDIPLQHTVFERTENELTVPPGFDAVTIKVLAKSHASLDFTTEKNDAEFFIKQGYKILFDLDLGLFKDLILPLSHHGQFQTLRFAIEQFVEKLYTPFANDTIGVLLFKGSLELFHELHWTSELEHTFIEWQKHTLTHNSKSLFCLDVAIDYVELLAEHLPLGLLPLIALDASHTKIDDFALMIAKERFERLHLLLKNPPIPTSWPIWQQGRGLDIGFLGKDITKRCISPEPTTGLLLTPNSVHLLEKLLRTKTLFKILSPEQLTMEWTALNQIIVVSSDIHQQLLRKLRGFAAAGGEILYIGKPLGIAGEKAASEFKLSLGV